MADLKQLLEALQDEAKAKQAEITAARVQLDALRSAHSDTMQKVNEAQNQLATHREGINEAVRNADHLTRNAQQRAGGIINEADKARREAQSLVRDAEERAARMIAKAQADINDLDRQITLKTNELKGANARVQEAQARLDAIRQQAKDFAGA